MVSARFLSLNDHRTIRNGDLVFFRTVAALEISLVGDTFCVDGLKLSSFAAKLYLRLRRSNASWSTLTSWPRLRLI